MLLALMVSMASWAQEFSGIQGTVTDDQGEPIIGASIVEKSNPQNGTITDFDGKFALKVNEGTPIIISYIGYTSGCGCNRLWCSEEECCYRSHQ